MAKNDAQAVIDSFGGAKALAEALQIPLTTVYSWPLSRYGIPHWRKGAIKEAAERMGVELPKGFDA